MRGSRRWMSVGIGRGFWWGIRDSWGEGREGVWECGNVATQEEDGNGTGLGVR